MAIKGLSGFSLLGNSNLQPLDNSNLGFGNYVFDDTTNTGSIVPISNNFLDSNSLGIINPIDYYNTLDPNNINLPKSGLANLDFGNISKGLSALTGLANAYTSYKNYGLSKDIYKTEKKALATNLANQAKTINNDYMNSAKVGLAMSNLSDEEKAKVLADTEKKFVKGTL